VLCAFAHTRTHTHKHTHTHAHTHTPCAPRSPTRRFIAQAATLPQEQVVNGGLKLRTRVLHRYLSPIDAEVG
jgi:hypothetical protein